MNPKKYNSVSIRYNTSSDGEVLCWRVVCDGYEHLTNKVLVKGELLTTKDYISDVGYKHHITIKDAIVDYSVDYTLIRTCRKMILKDIFKTITYRILGTSVTFGIGFLTTGNISVATTLGFSDLILKPFVYFIHERLWRLRKN